MDIGNYQIDMAVSFNSLIYYLKKLPFVGKHIPERWYGSIDAKSMLSTVRLICKILAAFFKKALYLFVMISLPVLIIKDNISLEPAYQMSMNILVFLSFLGGALFKNIILENSMNKYICIRLMRIPSRYYLLGDFLLKKGTDLAGFIVTLSVMTVLYGHGLIEGVICAFMLIACHLVGDALALFIFDKMKMVISSKTGFTVSVMLISLVLAYLPLYFDFSLHAWSILYQWLVIILILAAGVGAFFILPGIPVIRWWHLK